VSSDERERLLAALEAMLRLERIKTLEACAKVCTEWNRGDIAAAIRAMNEEEK
jgi:hypothetical protein